MTQPVIYLTESSHEVFLPTEHYTLNAARHEAAQYAGDYIGGWGRSRYLGRRDVPLHDHDGWEDCAACPAVPVWVFETYEGTWRR